MTVAAHTLLYIEDNPTNMMLVQQIMAEDPGAAAPVHRTAPSAAAPSAPRAENWKEKKKKLDKELRAVEKRLTDSEAEMQKLTKENEELNARLVAASSPDMKDVKKLSANGERIAELEGLWLQLAEEKEAWTKAIAEMVGQ